MDTVDSTTADILVCSNQYCCISYSLVYVLPVNKFAKSTTRQHFSADVAFLLYLLEFLFMCTL